MPLSAGFGFRVLGRTSREFSEESLGCEAPHPTGRMGNKAATWDFSPLLLCRQCAAVPTRATCHHPLGTLATYVLGYGRSLLWTEPAPVPLSCAAFQDSFETVGSKETVWSKESGMCTGWTLGFYGQGSRCQEMSPTKERCGDHDVGVGGA